MTTEATTETGTNYPLCQYDELPLRGAKSITLQGLNADGEVEACPLVVVRWDDQVYGYINTCPHTPIQLDARSAGQFFNDERTHLMCDKHGALFDVDTGVCLDGPCEGKGLTKLNVAVVDGAVCLTNVKMVEGPDS